MSENDCASFTWVIHNYSYYWQKSNEAIESPTFSTYMPEETKWKLLWFPRGESPGAIDTTFFLYRDNKCNGSENIEVKYSLDAKKNDGTFLVPDTLKEDFRKGMRQGHLRYVNIANLPSRYLHQDILTIRCTMSGINDKSVKMREIFARTVIGVEKQFFQWPIQNFSDFAPDQTKSVVIKSSSHHVIMQINLSINSQNNKGICLCIDYFDQRVKFSTLKTFIIDFQKQKIPSGDYIYWPNFGKEMFSLNHTQNHLMENKSLYLTNNVLTLSFELTISTGIAYEGIENVACEYTSHPFLNEMTEDWRKCITHKNLSDCPCALITDLTSLHKDPNTSDMKLQTKTNTFPVHTLILSARSPVFKAMFSNDMKEKINGCFDASDLHDETVRRFLLYLYSDQLEDLTWDDALQLYEAADKYAVISLRDKCSAFLKSNLDLENACNGLVLSDLHQDKELKEIIQSFILKNAKVIFKSEKWKILAKDRPKLALETTLRNWNEE